MSHRFPMLNPDGAALVEQSRALRAKAGLNLIRSRAVCAELAAMREVMPPHWFRAPPDTEHRHCAEHLIDIHGRYARRVALTCAANRACAEDRRAETFWSGVLEAIGTIQVH